MAVFPEAQYSRCIAKAHILPTSHALQELHHLQYHHINTYSYSVQTAKK